MDGINQEVRAKSGLTQWKNSQHVIDWFEKIASKKKKRFVCFDIVSFYPSIKKEHVLNALEFAKAYTTIHDTDIEIIMHACQTVLINEGNEWMKKDGTGCFDIPMGSFHGAELCDLVGLGILQRLRDEIPNGMFGLYRDDGLEIINAASPSEHERLSKTIRSLFSDIGFQITIETGGITTNFLDITLNLRNDRYHPFRKPNSNISYIHFNSNHPPHIKKAIPGMIRKRLSLLSKDEDAFNNNKADYEDALRKSGYKNHKLQYEETPPKPKNRRRRKKAIFFNAPYCQSVKTNVGKAFFQLIDRHFRSDHPYYEIFNRRTIKLSYSCMGNMSSIIKSHNAQILKEPVTESTTCNCSDRDLCPVNGNCLSANVVYKATVITSKEERDYIGSTGREFKKRFKEHMYAIGNEEAGGQTTLSNFVHDKTAQGENPSIHWKILHKRRVPNRPQKICTTCNLEKIEIAATKRKRALNERSELTGKCRHYPKFYF